MVSKIIFLFQGCITLPEINIAPENDPLEKEIPIGNPSFLGAMLVLKGGYQVPAVNHLGVYLPQPSDRHFKAFSLHQLAADVQQSLATDPPLRWGNFGTDGRLGPVVFLKNPPIIKQQTGPYNPVGFDGKPGISHGCFEFGVFRVHYPQIRYAFFGLQN